MTYSKDNDWWCFAVDAVLQRLVNEEVPPSVRLKAVAVLAVVMKEAKQYSVSSNLSQTDIARLFEVPEGTIRVAVDHLVEVGLVERQKAPGKGNRKVIVPLDPRKT